jgi:hypothetical protein
MKGRNFLFLPFFFTTNLEAYFIFLLFPVLNYLFNLYFKLYFAPRD